ncbi:MAG TPA: ABC transporter permease [Conexibacter sp.]|nr:ABC transporter permease [Conexibacter sp.]
MSSLRRKEREVAAGDADADVLGAMAGALTGGEVSGADATTASWRDVRTRFARDRVGVGALVLLGAIVRFCLAAPLFAALTGHAVNLQDYNALSADGRPLGPFSSGYLLGTDSNGRDLLVRLAYGGRVSLAIATTATLATLFVGVTLGMLAGYARGWLDTIVSRVIEVTMAFPFLLFAIALSIVGQHVFPSTFASAAIIVVIITTFSWFYPARIVRAQVLSLREREFIQAARMLGLPSRTIVAQHVLPHVLPNVLVLGSYLVGINIGVEAALSFLGVGLPTGTPSWGTMIQSASSVYLTSPWLMIAPGAMLVATTLATNVLGSSLNDAIERR